MLKNLILFSIRQRWLVLLVTLGLAALGVWNFTRLPIDAVPDITNVQVQINTEAAGYTPLEVEQRITAPLELELAGLPRLDYYRSLSRYGLSQITVVFHDGTDLYFARNQIAERLSQVRGDLPDGITPLLAPVATGPSCMTGSCARSCGRYRVWSRSTPSVATRSSSTSCPIRRRCWPSG
jgi:heavy metal efflux system protein